MKIVYRPAAIDDIRSAADYIEFTLKNPSAAARFKQRILSGISLLKDNPLMGQLLSDKYESVKTDHRFIIINKHFVFYLIDGDVIEIDRVIDGRTDYMTHLFGE